MMPTILAATITSAHPYTLALPGGVMFDDTFDEIAEAGWEFRSNGTVFGFEGQTGNQVQTNWISPASAATKFAWYLRYTNVVFTNGTISFDKAKPSNEDQWILLDQNRIYRSEDSFSGAGDLQNFTCDFQLSLDQSIVLATGNYRTHAVYIGI